MSDLLNGFNNGRDKSDRIGGNDPNDFIMKKKSKRETLADDLAEKMFSYTGKSVVMGHDPFYRFNNTLTREQYSIFRKEGIQMIQKALKINKTKAIGIFEWFWSNYGIRIKD